MGFFQNTCKPKGFGGKLMVKMMNIGHGEMAKWGFSKIRIEDNLKVLDVGCGGGANISLWLEKSKDSHVSGLDYSEVSVEESKKLNAKAIKKNRCKIVQGDVSSMSFSDDSFDVVSAFETIYFWPGLGKCFGEVNRILKKDGVFFICNELDGRNSTQEKWEKKIDGLKIYREEQIYEALENAGFKNIEVHREENKGWLCLLARK